MLVRLREPAPRAFARRRHDRPYGGGISHVTRSVTKGVTCAGTPIEEPPHLRLWLGLEPRPPVAEALQRDAVRLAIFPLVQVAARPCLVVRPPKSLALSLPRLVPVRHPALPHLIIREREQIGSHMHRTSVHSRDAYPFPCKPPPNSLFREIFSLLRCVGNSQKR